MFLSHISLRDKPPSNCSRKERKHIFLLDFQLARIDWDMKSCSKVRQGVQRQYRDCLLPCPRTRVGPPAERRFTITNNAFAYGTSEQRQAIEKSITADTTRKAAGGEQCGGAMTRAIPSRCRDGPRMGALFQMAASEVSSDCPLSYVADTEWVGYCGL